ALNGGVYFDPASQLDVLATFDPKSSCFASHCDWRIPTVQELASISQFVCSQAVCTDPTFGPVAFVYWSSTSAPNSANTAAWVLEGAAPPIEQRLKDTQPLSARAVRTTH